MISHRFRCIFVHIQRCGGSSVESWITGKDWWLVEPSTKHLLASQARRLYARYWDEYFKFALVRNPFTRMASCLTFAAHFGLRETEAGVIDFSGYRALYGPDVIIEHDHRFSNRKDLVSNRHTPNCVYGNILDEPLDFIARYECLNEDMRYVREVISHPLKFGIHEARGKTPSKNYSMSVSSQAEVISLYKRDFNRFRYSVDFDQRRHKPTATRLTDVTSYGNPPQPTRFWHKWRPRAGG